MRLICLSLTATILIGQSCSTIGSGFGSYERPSKASNKYYNRNFKLVNPKLILCGRYVDLDNEGLNANNANDFSYFVFLENGFVLHNSGCKSDSSNKPQTRLNYSDIYSEDIGSYLIKGDTIFWGTRPGYLKRKLTPYYIGIITDNGLKVIDSKFEKVKFLSLQ